MAGRRNLAFRPRARVPQLAVGNVVLSLLITEPLRWHCAVKVACLQSLGPRVQELCHTPSIAFWHPPPNSARFSYATEGALFISAQLSTDAVSALRKVWVLIRLWKQPSAQART